MCWGSEDIVSLAKEITTLIKSDKFKPLEARGGMMDGEQLRPAQVAEVSKWPSRAEQLSLLVGQILSPGANLASQLTSVGGALASQIEQKGGRGGGRSSREGCRAGRRSEGRGQCRTDGRGESRSEGGRSQRGSEGRGKDGGKDGRLGGMRFKHRR